MQVDQRISVLQQYNVYIFGTAEEGLSIYRIMIPKEAQSDLSSGPFDLPYPEIKLSLMPITPKKPDIFNT